MMESSLVQQRPRLLTETMEKIIMLHNWLTKMNMAMLRMVMCRILMAHVEYKQDRIFDDAPHSGLLRHGSGSCPYCTNTQTQFYVFVQSSFTIFACT